MMTIEDTYAEAFKGYYSEILVTAKNEKWLENAISCATGYATSTLGCDCEAGLNLNVKTDNTPDNRLGAKVQFHVPSWGKDPVRDLELALIHRIGQCILTCPTAMVFNATEGGKLPVGKKLGFFGDGFQEVVERFGRRMTSVPIMMGEFLIEEELGYAEGVMGGNLWLMGDSEDNALEAAEIAVDAISKIDGVITPFPGGVCSSGSKVGSRYKFLVASTQHDFCPTLKGKLESKIPEGVNSIAEIVINGKTGGLVKEAMYAGIDSVKDLDGLVKVSAGNYGGRLGSYKIRLKD